MSVFILNIFFFPQVFAQTPNCATQRDGICEETCSFGPDLDCSNEPTAAKNCANTPDGLCEEFCSYGTDIDCLRNPSNPPAGGGQSGGGQGTGGGQQGGGQGTEITNPIQSQNFSELMAKIAETAAKIGLPLVIVFIIYSGFLFVSARGDEEQLTKAKNTFFWAVIGALLVVGAFAIAAAIENFARQL